MSNNPYIVIIYSGATNKGANSIIASYIAAGVKKSGMNVVGPIDINFQDSQEEEDIVTKIANSSGEVAETYSYKETNEKYHDLINEFYKLTNIPILLNTSFNENEPIVSKPEEALDCFLRTKMDTLVMGNYIIKRS